MSYSSVLRIKSFRDLWLGQAISQFGDAFYYIIFMFMVERLTGSIAMVGVVGALETIPFLLFGPYSGIMADRVDRRKIMLLSDWISGLTLLILGLVLFFDSTPPIGWLLVTPFVLSSVRVFFMPAKSAALPALLPAELVQKGNALSMITQSMAPLIGVALSASLLGILFAQFPKWFFFTAVMVNALSFFGSWVYIYRLPAVLPDRSHVGEARPMTDFKEGVRYMRGRRDLLVLMGLLTMFRFMVAPFFVVYVAANKSWFGGKPQPLAWFEFSFFLGMIIASFFVGNLSQKRPSIMFSIGLSVVGLSVGLMGLAPDVQQWLGSIGAGTSLLGVSAALCMVVFWNIIAGVAVPYADIPIQTYMQLSVPDGFRGRVNSVIQMISTGVMPISMGLAGLLVAAVGVKVSFFIMGFGMVFAALIGLADPVYRAIVMPTSFADEKARAPELHGIEDSEDGDQDHAARDSAHHIGEPVRSEVHAAHSD